MSVEFGKALETGTIASIWHGNRGHLYVIAGIDRRDKTLSLIKHNCINNDGSIHAATRRSGKVHKHIGYEEFIEGVLIAPKINRVHGERSINKEALSKFIVEDVGSTTIKALTSRHEIYPSIDITADIRMSAHFA